MALKSKIKDFEFGVGDIVRVIQRIRDGEKSREAIFEGMIIAIRGREPGKTFMVRRIGEGGIGIEKIFPFNLPTLDKIVVLKSGTSGARHAKLYYTRSKSPTEVEMIFKRSVRKNASMIKSAPKKRNK